MKNTCLAIKTTHVFLMYALKTEVLNLEYMRYTWEIHEKYMFSRNTWEIHEIYIEIKSPNYMRYTWQIHVYLNTCKIHAKYINLFKKYMVNTCFAIKTTHVCIKNQSFKVKIHEIYMLNTWEIHVFKKYMRNTWDIHEQIHEKYMRNTWEIHGHFTSVVQVTQ